MMVDRPICVLIGALGGQGGGVLAHWLAEAAHLAGYPAQSTSIPGVAQRTGATTYYFELYPEKHPAGTPVFSLFPSAGDVDLMVALEPTEAGRALERGFITERTTVITSETRVYSTAEKSIAGNGAIDPATILKSLRGAAKTVIRLDVVNPFGREVNALAFGALIGTGVLPLMPADAREAIRAARLAVEANLASFELGLNVNLQPSLGASETPGVLSPPPRGFAADVAVFPDSLRSLVGHALARLVDYQDAAYARRYLDRLRPIMQADSAGHSYRLTVLAARRLAAWMSHEDVIRVAQLKTKPGRLARIRREVVARPGEPVTVEDFLSPSRDQLAEILPPGLARFLPGGNGTSDSRQASRRLRWRTFSPLGFAALKFLAALKPLRPRAAGFAKNQQAIDAWLAAVRQTTIVDYALACDVAELAVWARGYGDVRTRGLSQIAAVLKGWPALLSDPASAKQRLAVSLRAARLTPEL
jgi:indolepyruvate ferredoxin oxidoreductase beta subunit